MQLDQERDASCTRRKQNRRGNRFLDIIHGSYVEPRAPHPRCPLIAVTKIHGDFPGRWIGLELVQTYIRSFSGIICPARIRSDARILARSRLHHIACPLRVRFGGTMNQFSQLIAQDLPEVTGIGRLGLVI